MNLTKDLYLIPSGLEGALYAHEIRFAKTQKLYILFYGPTFGGH